MSEQIRVGFIGLGDQGAGMAHRLIDCGVPTTLWARREASLQPFRESGAAFAATPAELGAKSDVVGVCVLDDAGVQQVLLGESGVLSGMRPGAVLAIHSTISLDVCHQIARAADELGIGVIDAPVSGGGFAAAKGELAVLVGGSPEHYARALPALETFGGSVSHLGPLGSGLIAKLINNTLHAAHYALARDALAAGIGLGLDEKALGHVLSVCSGNSYSLNTAVMVGGFDVLAPLVGTLLRKDVAIFDRLAAEHGVPTGSLIPVADEALELFGFPRDRIDTKE
ncbi:NAD(P)-dependent oxidoreductase [Mycolicibacterium moriokaense]|uniref:3-hydroxyisobutyrate dehydrogenase-like beta-hydroxyacid dehydrogenase n=1 Tax=Mycolicibacterium moriokaense TaxID=39691 RepID=A0A318H902_9MYCO|nr:NAD(P)-dependent oxidoreductase [Mycolicibacterium moriokaense]PXX01630.1 3-hydroxyisobutyrate dehydrogenase-like beta-hydroxyacid dehydrogenase [Mycolicibacterium moriokaense]